MLCRGVIEVLARQRLRTGEDSMPTVSVPIHQHRAFLAELRRRKVWRTVAVYAVVALGITEAADIFFPRLLLPDWTVTLVVALAVLGLPAAVALSWLYVVVPDTGTPPPGESEDAVDGAAIAPFPAAADRRPAVVVLPFDNMSPDPSDAYLADGLTEEITADLAGIRALRVISRTSAFQYRGAGKDAGTIAQELNVGYVLEGSVRKHGDRLRITCQLIDAAADSHLWAHRHDGTMEDVFNLQERVARSVAESLELKLTPAEETSLAVRPLPDPAAYQCYLRARNAVWTGTAEALEQALRHLGNAAAIAGENALLHAAAAYVHLQRANFGFAQDEAVEAAEQHALKALELEPQCVEALVVLGAAAQAFRAQTGEAIRLLTSARTLKPGDLDATVWLANALQLAGRNGEAVELARTLVSVDPLSPISHVVLSHSLTRSGQFGQSVEVARNARRLCPDLPHTLFTLVLALGYAGLAAESRALVADAAGDASFFGRFVRLLNAAPMGDRTGVRDALNAEFGATCRRDPDWSLMVADYLALLGDDTAALDWLGNAVDRGFANYPFLAEHDPFMARLRDEPRFVGTLERCRIEWERFNGLADS
jgi:eukaryotic-like serine/threonine-protein kinase